MATKAASSSEIFIPEIERTEMTFAVLGTSPLICNRKSEGVMQDLWLPPGKKTTAEKASSLKHDPLHEYRNSPYTAYGNDVPTRIQLMGSMFKKAMCLAAIDTDGVRKTQMQRLLTVKEIRVDVYGEPQMLVCGVGPVQFGGAPDVRTRAILREWACYITISFITPIIRKNSVANLLARAGVISGMGDWRVEKGSGAYGMFQPVDADNKDFKRILKEGGREVQDAALHSPRGYDVETEKAWSWFQQEAAKRGLAITLPN